MKRIWLLFFVLISFGVFAQHSKINFGLKMTINRVAADKQIPLFVHGDVEQIKKEVIALRGNVKLAATGFVQVEIPAAKIESFSRNEFVDYIEFSMSKGSVLNDTMLIHNNVLPAHNGLMPLQESYTGKGVIMGFIDTGIDIYHPDFQDTLGNTRILSIWDQTLTDNGTSSYGYGQVWGSTAINDSTCTHTDYNGVDHGTHVSGIGSGNGLGVNNYAGVAPECNIVTVSSDQGAANWLSTVVDAVNYIYEVADSYGMPCSINVSMGDYYGSHDGEDAASILIDSIVNYKGGRAFVAAAGNAGSIKLHLEHQVNTDTSFTWFEYNASSALGYGSVFYEIWSDTVDFNNVDFAVGANLPSGTYEKRGATPFHNIQDVLGLQTDTIKNASGDVLGIVDFYSEIQGNKYLVQVHMQEPDSNQLLFSLMTTGSGRLDVWTTHLLGTSTMVDSPLPTNAVLPEIDYYVNPDVAKTMVSSFQNVESLITVANFANRATYLDVDTILRSTNRTPGEKAASSSWGPTRRGTLKPDIAATGDYVIGPVAADLIAIQMGSPAARKQVALGGMHRYNGGTSMASPVVAGVAALYLQKCPTATMTEVKNAIVSTAIEDVFTGTVPNTGFGYGKINAFDALNTSNYSPTILGATDICDGDSIQLFTTGYPSYLWSTGSTSSAIVFTEVTNLSGCRGWSDTVNVTWHALPTKPVINVIGNDTLEYATTIDLQWFYNTDSIIGANDTILVAQNNGDYYVQVTDANGCSANSDTVNVIILDINQPEVESGIVLYPNPNKGVVKIDVTDNEIIELILVDIQGKELMHKSVIKQENVQLDLQHLPNGIYYLKLVKRDSFNLEKVILAR